MLWISLHSPLPQLRARALIAVSEIPGVNPGGIKLVCRYKLAVVSKSWQKLVPATPAPFPPCRTCPGGSEGHKLPRILAEVVCGEALTQQRRWKSQSTQTELWHISQGSQGCLEAGDGHHFTAELEICGLWCVGMVFPTRGSALEFGDTTEAQCGCQQCF